MAALPIHRDQIFFAAGLRQIGIQNNVGLFTQPAIHQVHDEERKIVEYVPGGYQRIEFDRIEQHWRVADQDNVGEVKVAMDASHAPHLSPSQKERPNAAEDAAGPHRQDVDLCGGKKIRVGAQFSIVLVDERAQRPQSGVHLGRR